MGTPIGESLCRIEILFKINHLVMGEGMQNSASLIRSRINFISRGDGAGDPQRLTANMRDSRRHVLVPRSNLKLGMAPVGYVI